MARGSVTRRSGGWVVRLDAGPDPETGKRRQTSRQGFRTRRDAEAALRQMLNEANANELTNRSSETVSEYLRRWLFSRTDLKPTTFASYENLLKRIDRGLGQVKLQSLTPRHVEEFYSALLTTGGRNGGPLSAKSVRNTHTMLHRALGDAARLGHTPRNVAAIARAPRRTRRDFKTWSSAESAAFLNLDTTDRLHTAFSLLLLTGMRRGEALGLSWDAVDLADGTMSVVQTLVQVDGKCEFSAPKTDASKRLVVLDRRATALLHSQRLAQAAEQSATEIWNNEHNLVFTDEIGQPLMPEWFSKQFRRLIREAALPDIRLHDLRHTHATLGLRAGVSAKEISDRLGHSGIGITMDLYSHVDTEMRRKTAARIAEEIFEG